MRLQLQNLQKQQNKEFMNKKTAASQLKRSFLGSICLLFVFSAMNSFAGVAYDGKPQPRPSQEKPKELSDVGIEEKLGTQLDLNIPFIDENGQTVNLGQYFDGKTPVILSMVYYSCPGLCNFHLNGLTEGLKGVDWSLGQNYKMVAISFDPKENATMATAKKENYLKVYNRPGAEKGWHFLTGSAESIKKITNSIGFKYKWVEAEQEWSHASAAIVVTPKGVLSRYLPGVFFESRDLKLALNEATQGKIGNFIDSLVLYCFQYNPHQSKYTLVAFNLMKLGGGLMVLLMALWLLPIWRRSLKIKESARS